MFFFVCFLSLYFPAQLVGGCTLSDLLDKPWSQVSSLRPPRYVHSIFIAHRVQHSHMLADRHRMLLTHALALSANQFFYARKSPYEHVHSVRIELAKLILQCMYRIKIINAPVQHPYRTYTWCVRIIKNSSRRSFSTVRRNTSP